MNYTYFKLSKKEDQLRTFSFKLDTAVKILNVSSSKILAL